MAKKGSVKSPRTQNHAAEPRCEKTFAQISIDPRLTLREYYAGLAMQGLLASSVTDYATCADLSFYAVNNADALITELAKTKPETT